MLRKPPQTYLLRNVVGGNVLDCQGRAVAIFIILVLPQVTPIAQGEFKIGDKVREEGGR